MIEQHLPSVDDLDDHFALDCLAAGAHDAKAIVESLTHVVGSLGETGWAMEMRTTQGDIAVMIIDIEAHVEKERAKLLGRSPASGREQRSDD